MTLSEIEEKIQEYNAKLNEKRLVPVKGTSYKKRPIKGHLKSYILKEIENLKRQKDKLLNPTIEKVNIVWNNVIFGDGKIAIRLANRTTDHYTMQFSRKSFEYLKPYFNAYNLPKLVVEIKQNKIVSIENHLEVVRTFNILSFQEDFSLALINEEPFDIKNTIKRYSDISNDEISRLLKIKKKTDYIGFLCNQQSEIDKIVPLTEMLSANHHQDIEDSFLFTLTNTKAIYIVWESASINRATYVFKTNRKKYENSIQNIFNYLTSDFTTKRRTLRKILKKDSNNLGVMKVLEHNNLDEWKQELYTIADIY
jgi:hypothetical protein